MHEARLAALALLLGGCAAELAAGDPRADPASARAEEAPPPPPLGLGDADPILAVAPTDRDGTPPPAMRETDRPMPGMDMPGIRHRDDEQPPGPRAGSPHRDEKKRREPARARPDMPGMRPDMPGMGPGGGSASRPHEEQRKTYTCPMHPEVRSGAPGRCPKCGMTLVPVEEKR